MVRPFSSEPVDWVMSPSNLYDPRELRELLSNTLRSVPPTARLVFVLRDIGGFSLPETAEILGLSRTTVREISAKPGHSLGKD